MYEHNEPTFEAFLGARMKDKGISIKRLSEATGVAPNHIENMLHGNFDEMPAAPYFRGYLIRIGKVLDFDGEAWWEQLRHGGIVKNSGSSDALPRNRFMKQSPPKILWVIIAVVVILGIYLAFELPRILGKPSLTVNFPGQNPYTTASSTLTLIGTVQNADSLYLSNGDASSSEEIVIAPDGSWQKMVLLQDGPNSFELSAKKLLGRETDVTEEIIYEGAPSATSTVQTSTALFVPAVPVIPVATST